MNAGKYIFVFILLTAVSVCRPDSLRSLIKQGNSQYLEGYFDKAQQQYESALAKDSQNQTAQYNKANSLYKQKKYKEAIELYRQAAAAGSRKDVAINSKMNLGNSLFMDASENLKETPDKAIESIEQAVDMWRQVVDIHPDNKSAKRNIEVAKLKLRELKKQQEQQQQDQQQSQDPNDVSQDQQNQDQKDRQQNEKDQQNQDQQKTEDQQQKEQDQQQSQQQKDQEQKDQKQQDQAQSQQEENKQDQQQQAQETKKQQEKLQQAQAREQKADEILDQEKKARQLRILMSGQHVKVEKDW